MTLTEAHADQIAALLNGRNQLTKKYSRGSILNQAANYLCRFSESNKVIACVEVKYVQWYQTEVLHLVVDKSEVRKGHAKALLCEAERVSSANGARLLQCTIREDNTESRSLFEGFGFSQVSRFFNSHSNNNVAVFQKVLSIAR
jgi:ribosomal protein S18 acetylase RimI-like enzyme